MSTRRKKSKPVKKENESSSSDSEYTKTLEIITRLSQKYLSTGEKSAEKENISKDDAYDGDAENTTEGSESAMSTVGSSGASANSTYDFDEEDEMDSSPKTNANKNKSRKNKQQKKTNISKSAVKSKPVSKTTSPKNVKSNKQSNKSPPKQVPMATIDVNKTPVIALERLESDHIDSVKRQLRKRPLDNKEVTNNSVTPNKVSKTVSPENRVVKKNAVNNSNEVRKSKKDSKIVLPTENTLKVNKSLKIQNDSGVFATTPVSNSFIGEKIRGKGSRRSLDSPAILKQMPLLQAKDTSTPATDMKLRSSARTKRNDSCFGFDDPMPPAIPEISPVQKVDPLTPLSDYASMDPIPSISFEDSIHKESEPFQLFSMEGDEDFSFNRSSSRTYKVNKHKQGKKKVIKNPKIEKMLVEMNSKFDEIEKFELSIE